ncbi:hypothetical protein [Maribacter sp. R77961]|jgi:hypothetical protein
MKYLLIMQTPTSQTTVAMEEPTIQIGEFLKGIFKLTKKLFMI